VNIIKMRAYVEKKVGFMQGRLSPMVDGKIQAFPVENWQEEFRFASENGFYLMEWTLDQHNLYENPLMTDKGRIQIRQLMEKYNIKIPSLTGDCFMQAAFYKTSRDQQHKLMKDFQNIIKACSKLNVKSILMPLVDQGRIENAQQASKLKKRLFDNMPFIKEANVTINFESDLPPDQLANFIDLFDSQYFGITYDIGNSASLGYDPQEEINAYGNRINNVHVKDRLRGGMTVPLGKGNANFPIVLRALNNGGYSGNFILQTARAEYDDVEVLCRYRDLFTNWMKESLLTSAN